MYSLFSVLSNSDSPSIVSIYRSAASLKSQKGKFQSVLRPLDRKNKYSYPLGEITVYYNKNSPCIEQRSRSFPVAHLGPSSQSRYLGRLLCHAPSAFPSGDGDRGEVACSCPPVPPSFLPSFLVPIPILPAQSTSSVDRKVLTREVRCSV